MSQTEATWKRLDEFNGVRLNQYDYPNGVVVYRVINARDSIVAMTRDYIKAHEIFTKEVVK